MGMRICGIFCITYLFYCICKEPLNHQEVKETADRVSEQFKALVKAVVEGL